MMTTYPVERLVCRMAVPSIIIMMVSAMYNMADTFFVGSLGTADTAAVGISFSLMAIIQAVGFFFGHGSGNYIARALGARNNRNAEKMAAVGFFSAFVAGVLIALTGLLFLSPFARLLGATDTILPHTRSYLRFILIGAPFMVSSLTLNNLLRFQGSAFWGMIGMTGGAVLNVGLDPLFIFVLDMGITGAALATMISQTVSCTLLFVVSAAGKNNLRIRLRSFRPGLGVYRDILRGGIPSLLRQALLSLATIFLNHAAGGFSDAVIAAVSIVNRITLIAGAALLGLGQGFQPVCGFNYGAGRYDRVKGAFWFCLRLATVLLVLMAVGGFAAAPDIIALFRRDDSEVIRVGAAALRFQCYAFPLTGWIVLNGMMLQTIGRAVPASVMAFARQGIFLIPLLFLLTPGLGILGIQLCGPLADICTFILSLPLGIRALRQMKTARRM
ncbi:MAG: MATE family efflux transporter [Treponema sp.]|nr:MATE family efflux transporter [Treponema sp.]